MTRGLPWLNALFLLLPTPVPVLQSLYVKAPSPRSVILYIQCCSAWLCLCYGCKMGKRESEQRLVVSRGLHQGRSACRHVAIHSIMVTKVPIASDGAALEQLLEEFLEVRLGTSPEKTIPSPSPRSHRPKPLSPVVSRELTGCPRLSEQASPQPRDPRLGGAGGPAGRLSWCRPPPDLQEDHPHKGACSAPGPSSKEPVTFSGAQAGEKQSSGATLSIEPPQGQVRRQVRRCYVSSRQPMVPAAKLLSGSQNGRLQRSGQGAGSRAGKGGNQKPRPAVDHAPCGTWAAAQDTRATYQSLARRKDICASISGRPQRRVASVLAVDTSLEERENVLGSLRKCSVLNNKRGPCPGKDGGDASPDLKGSHEDSGNTTQHQQLSEHTPPNQELTAPRSPAPELLVSTRDKKLERLRMMRRQRCHRSLGSTPLKEHPTRAGGAATRAGGRPGDLSNTADRLLPQDGNAPGTSSRQGQRVVAPWPPTLPVDSTAAQKTAGLDSRGAEQGAGVDRDVTRTPTPCCGSTAPSSGPTSGSHMRQVSKISLRGTSTKCLPCAPPSRHDVPVGVPVRPQEIQASRLGQGLIKMRPERSNRPRGVSSVKDKDMGKSLHHEGHLPPGSTIDLVPEGPGSTSRQDTHGIDGASRNKKANQKTSGVRNHNNGRLPDAPTPTNNHPIPQAFIVAEVHTASVVDATHEIAAAKGQGSARLHCVCDHTSMSQRGSPHSGMGPNSTLTGPQDKKPVSQWKSISGTRTRAMQRSSTLIDLVPAVLWEGLGRVSLPQMSPPVLHPILDCIAHLKSWEVEDTRSWLRAAGLEVLPHQETAHVLDNPLTNGVLLCDVAEYISGVPVAETEDMPRSVSENRKNFVSALEHLGFLNIKVLQQVAAAHQLHGWQHLVAAVARDVSDALASDRLPRSAKAVTKDEVRANTQRGPRGVVDEQDFMTHVGNDVCGHEGSNGDVVKCLQILWLIEKHIQGHLDCIWGALSFMKQEDDARVRAASRQHLREATQRNEMLPMSSNPQDAPNQPDIDNDGTYSRGGEVLSTSGSSSLTEPFIDPTTRPRVPKTPWLPCSLPSHCSKNIAISTQGKSPGGRRDTSCQQTLASATGGTPPAVCEARKGTSPSGVTRATPPLTQSTSPLLEHSDKGRSDSGKLDQHDNDWPDGKPPLPLHLLYSTQQVQDLERSLLMWLFSLQLISHAQLLSGFSSITSYLQNGTLLCMLAGVCMGRTLAGVFWKPVTLTSRRSNIDRALQVLRTLPEMNPRYLSDHEEQLLKGERSATLGLLEDIHVYFDGLPPRGLVPTGPYLPFTEDDIWMVHDC